MIKIEPVKFSHIKQLQDCEGLFFTGVNDDNNVRAVLDVSRGFAMVLDELVLGAGGVIPMWPGVGVMWLMASSELKKHPRLLLRESRSVLQILYERGRFHRLQAYIDPAQSRHIRFVEALGFTLEGRMIQHTVDRKDHLLYARTY